MVGLTVKIVDLLVDCWLLVVVVVLFVVVVGCWLLVVDCWLLVGQWLVCWACCCLMALWTHWGAHAALVFTAPVSQGAPPEATVGSLLLLVHCGCWFMVVVGLLLVVNG